MQQGETVTYTPPQSTHYMVRCGETNILPLDSEPWDLTEGGQCGGTLTILDEDGCVCIYDKYMRLLVTDRKGEFHDLNGLGGTYYASCDGTTINVQFASR